MTFGLFDEKWIIGGRRKNQLITLRGEEADQLFDDDIKE